MAVGSRPEAPVLDPIDTFETDTWEDVESGELANFIIEGLKQQNMNLEEIRNHLHEMIDDLPPQETSLRRALGRAAGEITAQEIEQYAKRAGEKKALFLTDAEKLEKIGEDFNHSVTEFFGDEVGAAFRRHTESRSKAGSKRNTTSRNWIDNFMEWKETPEAKRLIEQRNIMREKKRLREQMSRKNNR